LNRINLIPFIINICKLEFHKIILSIVWILYLTYFYHAC
jgi:hypothetical protein